MTAIARPRTALAEAAIESEKRFKGAPDRWLKKIEARVEESRAEKTNSASQIPKPAELSVNTDTSTAAIIESLDELKPNNAS